MSDGGAIRIVTVRSKPALREFIETAYRLRGRDPHWVPPLRRDQWVLLDRRKHPVHEHLEVEYFLARRDGATVGRIAAIENHAHNRAHDEKIGFFGFLEAEDDVEVFRALFRAAEQWARRRGLTALRGPCSFSTNEECGLLISDHLTMPAILTPHNPPWYQRHVEACGFTKAEDLLNYWLTRHAFTERVRKLAEAVEKRLERKSIHVVSRPLDMGRWREELDLIKSLYNRAWEKNWGFVPMTDAEIMFVAKELKPLLNPRLVRFIEVDGEPAGFALCLPEWNVVLKHMNGRLNARGILTALMLKRDIKQIRLLMMGFLPEFRGRGFDPIIYRDIADACIAEGIYEGELGWVLERNMPMRRGIEAMGGVERRRYRIYERRMKDEG
jgi:GNAT superfamily N-acetyltransferase